MSQILEATSNGMSGSDWIAFLEAMGCHVTWGARIVLQSEEFAETVTNGVAYRFEVIKGSEYEGGKRRTKYIQKEADRRGCLTLPLECAPILKTLVSHERFEAMGLTRLIVMHKHVRCVSGMSPYLLGFSDQSMDVFLDDPDMLQCLESGFVFIAPPTPNHRPGKDALDTQRNLPGFDLGHQ